VLCFATKEDARNFQRGFGGDVCTLKQAITYLKKSAELATGR
jgi:hypothetical protein